MSDSFCYCNPIDPGIEHGVRDPQIFRHSGKWYYTATLPGFWQGEDNPGIKLFSSDDLCGWKEEAFLIERDKLSSELWYRDRFWAPELHFLQGKWYLCFNSCNESLEYPHKHGCCLAEADRLEGPYRVLTHDAPLVCGNDLHLFADDDGKIYAFWNCGYIFCSEIDLGLGALTGETHRLIFHSENPADWDFIGIEGSWVWKREGLYYLFYSSWTRGYEVGFATSSSIVGPWTKSPTNPVYGEIDPVLCEKHRLPLPEKHDSNSPFVQAGHCSLFRGPDGRVWLSALGMTSDHIPRICVDPLVFDENGTIAYFGPSYKEQRIILEQRGHYANQ